MFYDRVSRILLKRWSFLVADTQRILKQPGTEEYWACVEVSKILSLMNQWGSLVVGHRVMKRD